MTDFPPPVGPPEPDQAPASAPAPASVSAPTQPQANGPMAGQLPQMVPPAFQAPKGMSTGKIVLIVIAALVALVVGGFLVLMIIGLIALGAASGGGGAPVTAAPSTTAPVAAGPVQTWNPETPPSANGVGEPTVSRDGRSVSTDCFTMALPENYQLEVTSHGCAVTVNLPTHAVLTEILVEPMPAQRAVTLEDIKSIYARDIELRGGTQITSKSYVLGGYQAAYVRYLDKDGFPHGQMIIHDPKSPFTANGKPVRGFVVHGFENDALKTVALSMNLAK